MRRIILLFTFLLASTYVFSQQSDKKLTVDPNVKIGHLENGLTYYIRHNDRPDKKVELRLVVNAGSVLETDAQQGVAHFNEHMAFNGTKHFKKNDLVSYLQSIGVGFGSDLNAYTSFDETVYMLPIPTDNPKNITTGFQILQDWASNVTFDPAAIDAERPVILEESRLGKGANERMMRKVYPLIFNHSRYASRLPIGKDSIIKGAPYSVIKSFYKEWYRPDLMAVVVVGDIDVNYAEDLVKQYFSVLKNPAKEEPRTVFPVNPYSSNKAMVVTDPEATGYSYIINYSPIKLKPEETVGDYRHQIIKSLYSSMLNQRLSELTQTANPPFVFAGASFSSFVRGYTSFFGNIFTGDKADTSSLIAFETELERVKKFGFLQSELDVAKANMLNGMEQAFNERDKTNSADYVGEYIRNFLDKEPIPGIKEELDLYKELIPNIKLNDVNSISDLIGNNDHSVIVLMGPTPKKDVKLPTTAQILAAKSIVDKEKLQPKKEVVIGKSLIKNLPQKGSITNTTSSKEMGTTTYTLSNGILVTVKQTDFKNDEILMSGIRKGGKSNYWVDDKYDINFLIQAVTSMGVGDFTPTALKNALSGRTVGVAPTLSTNSEGFSGSSSVKDFETMLQLVYLYATQPRLDTSLFQSYIKKNKASLAFMMANPQIGFVNQLTKTMYDNSPLAPIAVPSPQDFDMLNVDKMMDLYKQIFGNEDQMHFYFVGNIDDKTAMPLFEQYLASLPSERMTPKFTDYGLRPITGNKDLNFDQGQDDKALIVRFYNGQAPYSEGLELKGNALSEVLNIKIIEVLREKIGGIYGGGTAFDFEKYPYAHYSFVLQLPCGPAKVDTLLSAFDGIVNDIITNGASQEDLEKVKKQWEESYKVSMRENSTWLSELTDQDFKGSNSDYFINYLQHVDALTTKDIQDAAKTLLSTKDVLTGVLRPAAKEKK